MAEEETTAVEADVVVPTEIASDTDSPEITSPDDEPTADAVAADDEGQDEGSGDDDTGDEEDAGEETAEEMLAFEFGGNKLEVPKGAVTPELAAKIDEFTKGTWSTFTKGQQENVERTKSLDARETTVAKLATLNGEALQTYSHGLQLRSEIEQLSQVDLNSLWQSDPDRARQISDLLGSKQAEFQNVIAKVGEQERTVQEAEQAEVGRRNQEGVAYLDKHIKNFSTEKADTLVKYVTETYGMPPEQAARWALNPVVTRMAYKAMLFDRQTGAKRPTAAPPQAKPVKAMPTKGANTGAERDPEKMSMGQLSKHLGLSGA